MRPEAALARLHALPLNFDEGSVSHHRWHVDELSQALPGEPPGEPVRGGAWHVARRLVEDYRIADPAIVRASWDPGAAAGGPRHAARAAPVPRPARPRRRARHPHVGRGPPAGRPPGARVRLRVHHAGRPHRDGPDGLRGLEVDRRRRRRVPPPRGLPRVRPGSGMDAARVSVVRAPRAAALLLPLLRAHRKADRARARPARRPAAARRPRARGRPRPHGRARGKPAPAQLAAPRPPARRRARLDLEELHRRRRRVLAAEDRLDGRDHPLVAKGLEHVPRLPDGHHLPVSVDLARRGPPYLLL